MQSHIAVPPPTSIPRIAPPDVAISVQADRFASPLTCTSRIAPLGAAIPAQVDVFAHPPTYTPRIVPLGPIFSMLLQALTFYAVGPISEFTTST